MNLKRWSVIVIVIALIGTVVGVSLDGAWAQNVSQSPQIQVSGGTSDPQLLAKGVGVSLPYIITCSGTSEVTYYEMYLEIVQRVPSKSTAAASAYTTIYDTETTPVCNGQPQTVTVKALRPDAGFFKKGLALARGYVYLCGIVDTSGDYPIYDCTRSEVSQEVRIR